MARDKPLSLRARATAPKAAAVAGIIFSVLFITSLGLCLRALPTTLDTAAELASLQTNRQIVILALNLVPFAGIAFLWFMGVVRDLLGTNEDQFFATVFLGSGLLFLAMIFTGAAATGSVMLLSDESTSQTAASLYNIGSRFAREIVINYAIRMAGVFMISTSTLFLRTRVVPRWIAFLGYGLSLVMLLRVGHIERLGWVVMFLPLWILLLSIYVLFDNYRQKARVAS